MMVLRNAKAMAANGLTTQFLAVDGVGPYTYSLGPDGPGGSIHAASGVYTSPLNAFGTETIIATDSDTVPVEATTTIAILTPHQLVCDIIATELGNLAGSVIFYNQKYTIPNDQKMYVLLRILSSKLYGNSNTYDSAGAGLDSVQSVNVSDLISIDIYSRSDIVTYFKDRVSMALKSSYAQNQYAMNSFFVSELPSTYVNLSMQEGPAMLYRFNATFMLKYFQANTSAANYFDQFESPSIITNEE